MLVRICSGQPFEECHINIQIPDGSVLDQSGRLIYISGERFHRDIVQGNCCFLCGNAPDKNKFTDEHIIPDWVLREYSLHNLKVTLPNGATGAKLDPRLLGSMYILPAKIRPHYERFDYADFSHHKTMMIRLALINRPNNWPAIG